MHYRYRRRSDDYCPVKVARVKFFFLGWASALVLGLVDSMLGGA